MAAMTTYSSAHPIGKWVWLRIFLGGLVLWIGGVALLAITQDPNLIPFVVLWGSFLVPVSGVAFFFARLADRVLSADRVVLAFVYGGGIGVLIAVSFEYWLLGDGPLQYVGVGLIEEAAKLIAIMAAARRLERYTLHDGLVIGAAVGFGFGAMESAGYALVSMFTESGISLASLIDTEILRGLLAPFGHGLWTGILGGVLFEANRQRQRLHITGSALLAYLGVALLHALWDSMHGIALLVAVALTGVSLRQRRDLGLGMPLQPTPAQIQIFTMVELAGMLVVTVLGVIWLVSLWRRREPFSIDMGGAVG